MSERWAWRTDSRGVVLVKKPGQPEAPLMLGPQSAAQMDKVIAQYEALAIENEQRTGLAGCMVPRGWTLAMVWRESNGYSRAVNPENPADPTDDGLGPMQLTYKYFHGGHTREELLQPAINLRIGTDYIASLIRKYGYDFPRVSAAYNAGSVRESDKNPFGMVSTGNHVESEVGALDYYVLLRLPADPDAAPPHIVSDEETMAQGAALLADLTRTEDFGARELSDEVS